MDTLNIPASVFLAAMLDAIVVVNESGLIFECNASAELMFGQKREDIFGKSLIETLTPVKYRDQYQRVLNHYFSATNASSTRTEAVGLRSDGTEFPVELAVTQIQTDNRNFVMASMRDISERKLAEATIKANEQNLERNRERVEAILNNSVDAILLISENFTIQQANPAFTKLFGYAADEMFNQTVDNLIHPNELDRLTHTFAALFRDQDHQFTELTAQRRDGTLFQVELGVSLVKSRLTPDLGIVCNIRDITELKRAQNVLAEERNLLRTLIDTVPDYIYIKDKEHKFVLSNIAHAHARGCSSSHEIIGKSDMDYFPSDLAAQFRTEEEQIFQTGIPLIDYEQPSKGFGSGFEWASSTKLPLKNLNGELIGLVGITRDITERKEYERQLRYQASLQENVSDAVMGTDPAFRIQSWNKAAERIYGWRVEETIGKNVRELLRTEYYSNDFENVSFALREQGWWQGEVIQYHKDGSKRHILSSVSLLKDENGTMFGVVAVNHDITERKLGEEREQKIGKSFRNVVEATDELLTLNETETLYKRAVELAREKLHIERCAIFVLDESGQFLHGTFGTDDNGETTDERFVTIPVSKNPELLARYDDPWWVTQDGVLSTWRDEGIRNIGKGWIATTIIRSGDESIGFFSNDAAISGSPLDPIQQESLAIFCSLLGNLLRRKRIEENLLLTTSRLGNLIENLDAGILLENEHRQIAVVNQIFCDLFSIPVMPESMIGADCTGNAEQAKHMFADPTAFVTRIDELLHNQQKVISENILLADGRIFTRDYVPIFLGERYLGHLWQYRDSSEMIRARQRQQRLMEMEHFQRQIADLFLHADDIKHVMGTVLMLVGQTLDVSRVYVAHFRKNERLMDTTLEWCAPGVASELENNQGVPYDELFPSLYSMLMQDGIVAPRYISELPEDMRTFLELRGFQAVLILPIYTAGRLEGLIGLADYRHDREWLPEKITSLRAVADGYARFLERKQAETALIVTRDTALRTAQIKSEFMSNMSHEIRTPMTGVLGMLELLLEMELDELAHQFADDAYQSAKKLLKIINDILDFSKIEAGHMVLNVESVDLRAVIHEISLLLGSIAISNGVQLIEKIEPDVPLRVLSDATRLGQILTNLVGNAVKFTRQGSISIRLSVLSRAENHVRLCFEVQDTGIGIPHSQLDKIFESFVQADGTSTRKFGGTGLGLAISKQLVELMGGEIEVKSNVGQGSTFSFVLSLPLLDHQTDVQSPLSSLAQMRILIYDEDSIGRFMLAQQLRVWSVEVIEVEHQDKLEHVIMETIIHDNQFDLALIRSTVPLSEGIALYLRNSVPEHVINLLVRIDEPNQSLNKEDSIFDAYLVRPIRQSDLFNLFMKAIEIANVELYEELPDITKSSIGNVLLAEDNELNQNIVVRALKATGYKVDIAKNGQEALDMLEQFPYDILLMDIHMPIMDGRTATKLIRDSQKHYRNIPIIAVTASALSEEQDEYIAIGMNEVVAKPFSLAELRLVVMKWVSRSNTSLPDSAAPEC